MIIADTIYDDVVKLLQLLEIADTQGACDIGGYLGDAVCLASDIADSLGLG